MAFYQNGIDTGADARARLCVCQLNEKDGAMVRISGEKRNIGTKKRATVCRHASNQA